MSANARRRHLQLETVTRLYDLFLEHSRSEFARAGRHVEQQKDAAKKIEQRADDARELARSAMHGDSGVSAEMLRLAGQYERLQIRLHAEQMDRVRKAEQNAEDARENMTRRFQALHAIEQLAERRAQEAALEESRAEQKILDERALERLAANAPIYKE